MARKLHYEKQLSVLLEKEQYEEINAIAEKQEVSQGEVARYLVRKGLIAFYQEGTPSVANS